MKTKSITALLFAAALIAPAAARAGQMNQDQGGAGASSGAASQGAVTSPGASGYNSSGAATDQGGAGTSAGTLDQGAAAHKLQGTIQSVDATSNAFMLKNAAGESQQVIVPQSAMIKAKNSSKQLSFADLKPGQEVTAQCDASGSASEIWLKSTKTK